MRLADCIALVESADNPLSLRFEPALAQRDAQWIVSTEGTIAIFNAHCTFATANMIACTSWGKYQLLGANLYFMGFNEHIARFLYEPEVQDYWFKLFVWRNNFSPDEDVSLWISTRFENFARYYNGPAAIDDYVASMRRALKVV